MKAFLQLVASDLHRTYADRLSGMTLVFPGRRARLFFADELSAIIKKPAWMPHCCSIKDLASQVSGYEAAETVSLISGLYRCRQRIFPESSENYSIDDFYHLGNTIIRDFDLLDKYLAPPELLLRNLRDLKNMQQDYSFMDESQIEAIRSFWTSFEPVAPNKGLSGRFLNFWDSLLPLYTSFGEWMEENHLYYEGALFRKMAQTDNLQSFLPSPCYVFIGFNALNACERKLMERLQKEGRALFYWDYDPYFLREEQEAGLFMRRNIANFPSPESFTKELEERNGFGADKTAEVIQVPSYVMQTKVLPEILARHNLPADRHTAVILADEGLLSPVLYTLSWLKTKLNVTMGYPFSESPLCSLMGKLAAVYLRYNTASSGSTGYRHSDLLPLLNHPLIAYAAGDALRQIIESVFNDNKRFIDLPDLEACPFLQNLLLPPGNQEDFFQRFRYLLETLDASETLPTEQAMAKSMLGAAITAVNLLQISLSRIPEQPSQKMLAKLLVKNLRSTRIPFEGEPLEGIQVMGMLETRCLNFDNLIILSSQEGFLPKSFTDASLIPASLKKAYGLPSPDEHEAMHAYYFYRLVAGAKNLFLVYSSADGGMVSGEQSRFIRQLRVESAINIQFSSANCDLTLPQTPPIRRPKAGMEEFLKDGGTLLTPSSVKRYLKCPLSFYFNYIENVKDTEEVQDEVNALSFGLIVHKILENLYKPFKHRVVTKEDIERIIKDKESIQELMYCAFEEIFKVQGAPASRASWPGQWLILSNVVLDYVKAVLSFDKSRTPFVIDQLEKYFELNILLDDKREVRMGGIIDRLEVMENDICICDYKTGRDNSVVTDLKALFNGDYTTGDALQILMYAYLYALKADIPSPQVRLYYIRSLVSGQKNGGIINLTKKPLENTGVYQDAFLEMLHNLLEEMFDYSKDFEQTQDTQRCKNCSYSVICQR